MEEKTFVEILSNAVKNFNCKLKTNRYILYMQLRYLRAFTQAACEISRTMLERVVTCNM